MRIDDDPNHDTVNLRLHETPKMAKSDEIEPRARGVLEQLG